MQSVLKYFLTKVGVRKAHGTIVKVLDCGLKVSEFKLQSCYYVHFWTNTLGKGMNHLMPHYGLISTTAVLLQGWLCH